MSMHSEPSNHVRSEQVRSLPDLEQVGSLRRLSLRSQLLSSLTTTDKSPTTLLSLAGLCRAHPSTPPTPLKLLNVGAHRGHTPSNCSKTRSIFDAPPSMTKKEQEKTKYVFSTWSRQRLPKPS